MLLFCFSQLPNSVTGVMQVLLGKVGSDGVEQFAAVVSALPDSFNLAAAICHDGLWRFLQFIYNFRRIGAKLHKRVVKLRQYFAQLGIAVLVAVGHASCGQSVCLRQQLLPKLFELIEAGEILQRGQAGQLCQPFEKLQGMGRRVFRENM